MQGYVGTKADLGYRRHPGLPKAPSIFFLNIVLSSRIK